LDDEHVIYASLFCQQLDAASLKPRGRCYT